MDRILHGSSNEFPSGPQERKTSARVAFFLLSRIPSGTLTGLMTLLWDFDDDDKIPGNPDHEKHTETGTTTQIVTHVLRWKRRLTIITS